MITILKANYQDLDELERILLEQKNYLKDAKIPQWQGVYPSRDTFKDDIDKDILYAVKDDDKAIGFFALVYPDPNYSYIEDGKWLIDTPYIAVHRMGITNSYKGKGVAKIVLDYLKGIYDHIRIDTHALNNSMNRCLIKNGFTYCGIVYMEDKTKRNAYEWYKKGSL